ncbi:MAG TPA: hypothetical protein VIM92_01255 [Rhodanobacteraceae bacterium]
MRLALIPSSLVGGGAALASAAGIVVWNLCGAVFVRSRLDANPTVLPLSR